VTGPSFDIKLLRGVDNCLLLLDGSADHGVKLSEFVCEQSSLPGRGNLVSEGYLPNTTLAHYSIVAKIGAGGMGGG